MILYECSHCGHARSTVNPEDASGVLWCPNRGCSARGTLCRVEVYSKREVLELLFELFDESASWADQGEDGEGIAETVDVADNDTLRLAIRRHLDLLTREEST